MRLQSNKPVFALDVDGVLADFVGRMCARMYERAPWLPITPRDITTWELSACMSSEAFALANEVMHEPGFAWHLDAYPGAKELVDGLRKLGHVVALTAPLGGSPTWIDARTRWLEERMGFDRHDIVFCPSKHKHMFACDELVEDNPKTLENWRAMVKSSTAGFLVRRPWTESGNWQMSLEEILYEFQGLYT